MGSFRERKSFPQSFKIGAAESKTCVFNFCWGRTRVASDEQKLRHETKVAKGPHFGNVGLCVNARTLQLYL